MGLLRLPQLWGVVCFTPDCVGVRDQGGPVRLPMQLLLQPLREVEVRNNQSQLVVDQQVLWLDVSVDNTAPSV